MWLVKGLGKKEEVGRVEVDGYARREVGGYVGGSKREDSSLCLCVCAVSGERVEDLGSAISLRAGGEEDHMMSCDAVYV